MFSGITVNALAFIENGFHTENNVHAIRRLLPGYHFMGSKLGFMVSDCSFKWDDMPRLRLANGRAALGLSFSKPLPSPSQMEGALEIEEVGGGL